MDFYGPWKDYTVDEIVNRYRFMMLMPDIFPSAREWIMNRLRDEFDHALFIEERVSWRSFSDILTRYNDKATEIARRFIDIHGISPIKPGAFLEWIMWQKTYYKNYYGIKSEK